MIIYFIESIHGIVVEVCDNLPAALKAKRDMEQHQNATRKRVYCVRAGMKVYIVK